MDKILNLTVESEYYSLNILVDNSTEFKDLAITSTRINDTHLDGKKNLKKIDININTLDGELTINGIILNGVALDIFRKFINQK